MKELLSSPIYSSIAVFIMQVVMLFLRTINIIYTAERNIHAAIWTNNGVSLMWLASMTIGVNSMLNGEWFAIGAFLLGGSIGTYIALKIEIKYRNKKIKP